MLIGASPGPATATVWGVSAIAETSSTPSPDDICIWVHPNEREKSIVIGTRKSSPTGGLYAWDLDAGTSIWNNIASENAITNNVDVRYGFPAQTESWDIVCATNRTSRTIDIYRVETDGNGDFLGLIKEGSVPIGDGWATGTNAPYGCAMFQVEDRYYCFISDKTGNVGQFRLQFDSGAPPGLRIVGTREVFWDVTSDASEVEGLVADDLRKVIYIAAENHAIYRFDTKDDLIVPSTPVTVAVPNSASGPFVPDVEGLTLWYSSSEGEGYLIASSQGSGSASSDFYSTFAVFDRAFVPDVPNEYLFNYQIMAGTGALDRVTETDGIDVVNLDLGLNLEAGLMVAHDDSNDDGGENYKYVSWQDIATSPAFPFEHLRFIGDGEESGWDPRTRTADGGTSSTPPGNSWPEGGEATSSSRSSLHLSPQPFTESTVLRFRTGAEQARVSVFNLDGREVALLGARTFSPGLHALTWDGTNTDGERLAAGSYWIRVQTSRWTRTVRAVLTR